jgi:hypothetical protein
MTLSHSPPLQRPEQQSEFVPHERNCGTQQVELRLQMASPSQQSELSVQAPGAPFSAQHLPVPLSQVAPLSQQSETLEQPVIPVGMQHARWILHVAFGLQQSKASLQTLWMSTSVCTQHFPAGSQVIPD